MLLVCGVGASYASELDSALRAALDVAELRGRATFTEPWPKTEAPVTRLGRELFFSKTLSGDQDTACASCHHPFLAGGDALSLPVGAAARQADLLGPGRLFDWKGSGRLDPDAAAGPNVPRNSPTIFNVGLYERTIFFDGRLQKNRSGSIRSPESVRDRGRDLVAVQARLPVVSEDEMRGYKLLRHAPPDAVREVLVKRLQKHWTKQFAAAFGDAVATPDSVTYARVEQALSDFQRSFVLLDNPWFRYVAGEVDAIDDAAKRGALDFLRSPPEGGLGCAQCHQGDFFTDEQFHTLAFPQIGRGIKRPAAGYGNETERDSTDNGRWEVTRQARDRFAFRTPSLLNVQVTGPYGHAGTHNSLEQVISHHLDPERALQQFDFSLSELVQFQHDPVRYPEAARQVPEILRYWRKYGQSNPRPPAQIPPSRMQDLKAFLNALTDPCAFDRTCLSAWIPDRAERSPDGQRLTAKFLDRVTIATNP